MFSRSGLDTEKETFNILSPSQNPLPNDILLILDLQFMDIEIWCVHMHMTTLELKQTLISTLSNVCAQNLQVLYSVTLTQNATMRQKQWDASVIQDVSERLTDKLDWFYFKKDLLALYGFIWMEYHLELFSKSIYCFMVSSVWVWPK